MATFRPVAVVATLALTTACYRQEPDFYSTLPEPTEVQGPPSGDIDPQWQAGYADDNASGAITASTSASADPLDPGYVMGACTDGEIDATLTGYGEWVYIEGYGEVWRPYTTVVGVDFTPYETCGSWVWTDWGWTFACEWDWGWLPFHYGRWGWFDDYWAWQPDYEWSPAWVDWRGGGGYVGWRPQGPIVRDHRGSVGGGRGATGGSTGFGEGARDHRGEHDGVVVRDHRTGGGSRVRDHRTHKTKDWQWRFASAGDFGKPRIRAHLFKSPAEGLRVTSIVMRPPLRATVQPVKAASIMQSRLAFASRIGTREARSDQRRAPTDARIAPSRSVQPGRVTDWHERRPARPAATTSGDSSSVYQPTYQPPRRAPGDDRASTIAPQPSDGPSQEFGGLPITPTTPTPTPDDRPQRSPVTPTPTQPSYEPPAQHPPRTPTHSPPAQPTYQPPASHPPRAPTYTAPPPTRAPERSSPATYSPPSRPSSPPPSYSPPARSSSSSSYSPPARSSPPPSYSPPARSSSSSSSYSSSSSSSGGGSSRSHRR
jgi:hypothetical protein